MFRIWDKKESLVLADGKKRTPEEVYAEHPWARHADAVMLEVHGGITGGIDNLAHRCEQFGVDVTLPPEEALEAVKAAIKAQKAALAQPSAEERIAAMLEYQALMSL